MTRRSFGRGHKAQSLYTYLWIVPQAYDFSVSGDTPSSGCSDRRKTLRTLKQGAVMTVEKIVGLIGIAIAILSAFVTIPHVFTILVVAGLIVGFSIAKADHVRLILTALALFLFAPNFGTAPVVGKYLAPILMSGGYMAMGASLMAILRNLYERFSPGAKPAAS